MSWMTRSMFPSRSLLGSSSLVAVLLFASALQAAPQQDESEGVVVRLADRLKLASSSPEDSQPAALQGAQPNSGAESPEQMADEAKGEAEPAPIPADDAKYLPRGKGKRYCLPQCFRAGFPHLVSPFAKPSVNERYEVGYVGGGSAIGGSKRYAHEGTFGLDYSGWVVPRNIWLNWNHGKREQGGEGAYKTDGPKFIEHE